MKLTGWTAEDRERWRAEIREGQAHDDEEGVRGWLDRKMNSAATE
jgi:hypothetical protein